MGVRDEACERLIDTLKESIEKLEQGKEECVRVDWELIPPEELEEVIDRLYEMLEELNETLGEEDSD
jgi:hypothetical protein